MFDQIAGFEVFRFDEEIAVRPADHAEIGELELGVHHPEYDALPVVTEHREHQRHIAGRLMVRYEQNVLVLLAGDQLQFGLFFFDHDRLFDRIDRVEWRAAAVRSAVTLFGLQKRSRSDWLDKQIRNRNILKPVRQWTYRQFRIEVDQRPVVATFVN